MKNVFLSAAVVLFFAAAPALAQAPTEVPSAGIAAGGAIGVNVIDLDKNIAQRLGRPSRLGIPTTDGALVADVLPGSAAARSAILVMDVFTSINGEPVVNSADMRRIIAGLKPGSIVKAKVWRLGEEMDFNLLIGWEGGKILGADRGTQYCYAVAAKGDDWSFTPMWADERPGDLNASVAAMPEQFLQVVLGASAKAVSDAVTGRNCPPDGDHVTGFSCQIAAGEAIQAMVECVPARADIEATITKLQARPKARQVEWRPVL